MHRDDGVPSSRSSPSFLPLLLRVSLGRLRPCTTTAAVVPTTNIAFNPTTIVSAMTIQVKQWKKAAITENQRTQERHRRR